MDAAMPMIICLHITSACSARFKTCQSKGWQSSCNFTICVGSANSSVNPRAATVDVHAGNDSIYHTKVINVPVIGTLRIVGWAADM